MKQWIQSSYKNFERKRKESNNEVHKNNPNSSWVCKRKELSLMSVCVCKG